MDYTTLIRRGAMAWAIILLGLQLLAAWEHNRGGSLYALLSMCAAMITLAGLPIAIVEARRSRAYGIVATLLVGFAAFLAYSLPATIGRTSEPKELQVQEAKVSGQARSLLEDELRRTNERLRMATADVPAACKNPYSDRCKGARLVESERQARADQLRHELSGAPAPLLADVSSSNIGWALGLVGIHIDDASVRKLSPMMFAFGLDWLIWALVWFASSDKVAGRQLVARPVLVAEPDAVADNDPDPLPPARMPTQSEVISWRTAFHKRHGRMPLGSELQMAFAGVPKTSAYRWARGIHAPRAGRLVQRRVA